MDTKVRVLIIDDVLQLAQLIAYNLELKGFEVECAYGGKEGLQKAFSWSPSVVVLDILMPDMTGFEVLEQLRKSSNVPVIMLTAQKAVEERMKAFALGADDYITKPCSIDELAARIQVQGRRAAQAQAPAPQPRISDQARHLGDLSCDPATHSATYKDRVIPLQNLECRVLEELMKAEGNIVTHEQLLSSVRGSGNQEDVIAMRVTISKLRRKLRSVIGIDPIRTVYGVGYKLSL